MSTLPTHYQLRIDTISHAVSRLPADAASPVVLLGDVHVEKNPAREIADALVINMGIEEDHLGGDSNSMRERLWLLPMARPGHVVIMAGFNDLLHGISPLEIEKSFIRLIAELRKQVPRAQLHVASIPPTREKYAKLMHEIAVMNGILEELAEKQGLAFVDMFSILEDDEGQLSQNYSNDGLHLNDEGFDRVNEMLERHLSKGDSY